MTSHRRCSGTASSGKALWYLTRSTGLVALVLLTATVVLGVVASVGWTTERWPRFLSQDVHRNLSLLCVGFVAIHVVTTVSDGYVPIGFADAFIPFRTAVPAAVRGARGALLRPAAGRAGHERPPPPDRLRLVAVRPLAGLPVLAHRPVPLPGQRHRHPAARGPACWTRCARPRSSPWWSGGWPPAGPSPPASGPPPRWARWWSALALLVFAALGPLRPGWSHRAGTSTALLAQLAKKNAGTARRPGPRRHDHHRRRPTAGSATGTAPSPPFTVEVAGTQSTSSPNARARCRWSWPCTSRTPPPPR